jgi:hypothetical protein
MKTWKIITVVGVALVAIALVTASAVAYMGGGIITPYGTNTGVSGPFGVFGGMMGGGMMGQNYGYNYGATTTPTYTGQYGTVCPGRNGYFGSPTATTGTPIAINTAVSIAQQYVVSLTNKDLAVDEVEEYTQNFYVLVKEKSTGLGAFELLINKYTGSIAPEIGPNMMWNTKYGMMSGGMMGWVSGTAGPMTVTIDQAKTEAQQFLTANYPGTAVGSVDTFYGYYHIDVLSAGNTFGMLSVNGCTGQVWYHTWHGSFIQAVKL